ncbi:unnamed protein product [marine sediment metagenome]|uniref:Uncharacterized protein n=1 Tax=marine sediment metagenome TaxID=412755 RepID=X1NMJ8_9ZZZZ
MNIEKKRMIKSITTKIHYHEKKIQELSETKNLLTKKTVNKKPVNTKKHE